jgi:hypothetical protein
MTSLLLKNKYEKKALKRVPMNELQIKLFDFFHKERKFSKRDAKRLCKGAKITSFEDWLVKYKSKGCRDMLRRSPGVSDWADCENYDNKDFGKVLYNSDDDDCNDHI